MIETQTLDSHLPMASPTVTKLKSSTSPANGVHNVNHSSTQHHQNQHQHHHNHHSSPPTSRHHDQSRKGKAFPGREMKKRDSVLSTTQDIDSMIGFVRLACILLFTGTLQFCIRSYMKNGIFMDLSFIQCIWGDLSGALLLIIAMYIYSLFCLLLVKLLVDHHISILMYKIVYSVYQLLLYLGPIWVVFKREMGPLMGALVSLIMIIISLKLHAYFATNQIFYLKLYHRKTGLSGGEKKFPKNVNFNDFVYFMAAPTLVYEISYPRNEVIRYWWAAKELMQCILCFSIANIIITQFIIPVLTVHASDMVIYDYLQLTIPSVVTFILCFYGLFHCYLNFLAEILGFGDREFYKDWWNAPSLDIFWRKWNILVHEWLFRHVYLESRRAAKAPSFLASMIVFLFSAIYHELVFFMAFRFLRPWFFLAMFLQVPMIFGSRLLYQTLNENHRDRWGNVFFWLSFFLGQPLIEILYLKEWFSLNPSLICTPSVSPEITFL